MATVTLTARYLDQLKPQRKRYEVFDTIVPGFAIRVTPAGHKSRTLYYRHHDHHRQSIYRFRGASPHNMRAFSDDFPGAKILPLTKNYRSAKKIVRVVSGFAAAMTAGLGEEHFSAWEGSHRWRHVAAGEAARYFYIGLWA
jgi:hypothetical protein